MAEPKAEKDFVRSMGATCADDGIESKVPIIWADRPNGIEVDFSQIHPFIPFKRGKVIFGGFFGDCGKGKQIDITADKYHKEGLKILSCSGQGSGNSGHTVEANGRKYDFHYMTSAGLIAEEMHLGPGKYIDPIRLLEEMEQLPNDKKSIVTVSNRATIVTDAERAMDAWCENKRTGSGQNAIGTTKSGVGPVVGNKGYRVHVTFADALGEPGNERTFAEFMELMRSNPLNPKEVQDVLTDAYLAKLWEAIHKLNVVSTEQLVQECRISGDYAVLLEVSQAVCLDPHWGNGSHYTTSSPCTPVGAMAGMGLTPQDFSDGCEMVIKAYGSKVGGGPYITKFTADEQDVANVIYRIVGETGVTTGRKRDLGWLDAPAIRHSIALTGAKVFVNCMDVMPEIAKVTNSLKACFAYRNKYTGEITYDWPYNLYDYEPLYAELPVAGLTDKQIIAEYILFIEKLLGQQIIGYGVGPKREDYRERSEAFA